MNLTNSLNDNLQAVKSRLDSDDVHFLDVKTEYISGCLIFADSLTNKEAIGELILRPLNNLDELPQKERLENLFLSPEKKEVNTVDEVCDEVVIGNSVLILEGVNFGLSFGLKFFEQRAITEPPTSAVLKGPREGFVESLPVNISMMRRRLKTASLRIENLTVGRYSKTPVAICYIDGIADKDLVESLRKKISEIDIDAVLDSSYLAKFLGDRETSLFKQVGNTEKPDILASKILEGRIALLVDGSPIVLTVPYLLIEDFQSAGDYYTSGYNATLARNLRLFAVIISVILPGIYVASELFHLQLIPLSFLLTIVNSIKGIPLSPSSEMLFTLFIFEILNEASVRMPRYVGMVVSIVGGLVLGETAVTAGIISAPTLMIIAFSGICLYTVPELEQTFSIIRLLFLVVGGLLGGYGLINAFLFLIIYLISFENFSTPIMAPFSPLVTQDLKDTFFKEDIESITTRPLSLRNFNKTRLKFKRNDNG